MAVLATHGHLCAGCLGNEHAFASYERVVGDWFASFIEVALCGGQLAGIGIKIWTASGGSYFARIARPLG